MAFNKFAEMFKGSGAGIVNFGSFLTVELTLKHSATAKSKTIFARLVANHFITQKVCSETFDLS